MASGSNWNQPLNAQSSQKKILIDGINYGEHFGLQQGRKNVEFDWELALVESEAKINQFVAAARKSGIILEVFMDVARSSKEAEKKFRKRRETELLQNKRRAMPLMRKAIATLRKALRSD